MQYSISNWIYAMEDLEKSLQRLAKYKYDAVELEGEPDKEKYEPKKVKKMLQRHGLKVSSIAGMYPWKEEIKRDLASSDKKIREQTINIFVQVYRLCPVDGCETCYCCSSCCG